MGALKVRHQSRSTQQTFVSFAKFVGGNYCVSYIERRMNMFVKENRPSIKLTTFTIYQLEKKFEMCNCLQVLQTIGKRSWLNYFCEKGSAYESNEYMERNRPMVFR